MNSEFYNNLIFYNGKKEQFLNSQTINFLNPDKQNRIILDKIFVNLHKISLDSKKKDDLFLIILKERLEQIFELYQLKKQLISKKLNNSKDWNNLCSLISDNTSSFLLDNSIKSISFIGLNKAIEHHCGIELDRIETSEKFACKILKFMLSVIKEKNTEENELYTLSQPHYHNFINQATRNGDNNGLKFPYYTPNIVRESSNLTLAEKIQLHKRFEDLLYGGVIFEINSQNCEQNPIELYKLLTEAQLNAFRIN